MDTTNLVEGGGCIASQLIIISEVCTKIKAQLNREHREGRLELLELPIERGNAYLMSAFKLNGDGAHLAGLVDTFLLNGPTRPVQWFPVGESALPVTCFLLVYRVAGVHAPTTLNYFETDRLTDWLTEGNDNKRIEVIAIKTCSSCTVTGGRATMLTD